MDSLNHSCMPICLWAHLGKTQPLLPKVTQFPNANVIYLLTGSTKRSCYQREINPWCLNWMPVCLFTEIKCHSNMRMDLSRPICKLWPTYKMAGGTWMVTGEHWLSVSQGAPLNMIALRELKRDRLKNSRTN